AGAWHLLLLPSFVIVPVGESSFDVSLLALFRTAAKQNDKCLAVLAEVNAIAGAEVELVFETLRGRHPRHSRNSRARSESRPLLSSQRPRHSDCRTMPSTGCGLWCR